jgi:ribosomal protein S26
LITYYMLSIFVCVSCRVIQMCFLFLRSDKARRFSPKYNRDKNSTLEAHK